MRACKPLPYGQLTTALVRTVPSPCFLRQSSTVAKVRETFCVSFVLIRFVIGELLSEVGGRVSHGLVLAWFESYVLRLVFLDSSLKSPGQEKDFGILFIPLHVLVREIQLSVETYRDNGRPSMVFGSVSTLLFITWHFEITSAPRKRERNIWVPFLSMYALWFSS